MAKSHGRRGARVCRPAALGSLAALVLACTPATYSPALFEELPLGPGAYQVRIRTDRNTDTERASDYVLLRSAEKTLDDRRRYFWVTNYADQSWEQTTYTPAREFELPNCEGEGCTFVTPGSSHTTSEIVITYEILTLDSPQREVGEAAYDAILVRRVIRAKYAIPPDPEGSKPVSRR